MQSSTPWQLARRAERLEPSVIREILKVTERPGVISLAGGLPAPESFPVEAMREACQRVLTDTPREALQYAASEGYGPLRDWVAHQLGTQGLRAVARQHRGAGRGEFLHREGLGRGQAAGQADDAGLLGDLEDLADHRGIHLVGALRERPVGRGQGRLLRVWRGMRGWARPCGGP